MRFTPFVARLLRHAAFDQCPLGSRDFKREAFNDDGFVTIFDGKSLNGWHVSAKSGHSGASKNKSGGKWVIEDGAIIGSQDIPGNGGIIITDEKYGDFEVTLEMKNDFGPDSGLFLRSTEKGQAYQSMIDYHANGNLVGIYGEGLSGGIHHRELQLHRQSDRDHAERRRRFRCPSCRRSGRFWKHGQWNELRARIVGNPPKITTWINGVKFMEFQDKRSATPTPAASPCKSTAAATTPSSSCAIATSASSHWTASTDKIVNVVRACGSPAQNDFAWYQNDCDFRGPGRDECTALGRRDRQNRPFCRSLFFGIRFALVSRRGTQNTGWSVDTNRPSTREGACDATESL